MTTFLRRFAPTSTDALWLALAAAGLAMCLMLTGTFDTVLAMQLQVASFDFRIAGTPFSGNSAVVVTCALAALCAWRFTGAEQPGKPLALALSAIQATAAAALFLLDGRGFAATSVALWVTLAVSSTVQLVSWAQLLAQIGRERSLATLAASLALVSLANVALEATPRIAVAALTVAAALCSPFLLLCFKETLARRHDLFAGAAQANDARPVDVVPTCVSMASLVCYGIGMGYIQSVGFGQPAAPAAIPHITQICTLLFALAVAGFAVVFEHLESPGTLLRALVLAVLLAIAHLSAAFGEASATWGMVSTTLTRVVAFAYVWLLACAPLPHPTRAAFMFACGWGLFTLALTVSTKLGIYIAGAGSAGSIAYQLLVSCSLAGLALLNLYPQLVATRPSHAANACGELGRPEAADAYELGCELLAHKFDLTPREAQVLLPLVRGRSNSSIAATLDVGTETVRTHIRHIYQKTGIHSREELMDTVEELARGAGA